MPNLKSNNNSASDPSKRNNDPFYVFLNSPKVLKSSEKNI